MPINSFLYPGAKVTTGYDVDNSLRFNSGSSDYLTRTPSSATNQDLWSLSFWIKRSNLGSYQSIYGVYANSTNQETLAFDDSDRLYWQLYQSSAVKGQLTTNRVFRDVSAFYNILIVYDSANGTAGNRMRMYINGVEETSFATDTNPSSGQDSQWNSTTAHTIGRINTANYMNGYISELVAVDGTALSPTDVGEFDSDTNIWKPKNVSGLTFGNNGFYLDFEDSSALGNDAAGSNNFTVNNLTAIDQSTDTCTNNFATLNSVYATGSFTFTDGNLTVDEGSISDASTISTIGFNQGKWYLEFKIVDQGSRGYLGFTDGADRGLAEGDIRSSPAKWGMYMPAYSSSSNTSGTVNSNLGTATDNDIICFAFDADNGQLFMSKNGNVDISSTAAITGITTGNFFHFFVNETASGADLSGYSINFGSPAYAISSGNTDADGYGNFEYAVPSGYYSLNSKNLAEYG